jgi:two-component system cell cycle sensor histidine kinase PleC
LHGGTFSLKSKLRIGTEIVVTFPPERVVAAMAPMDAPPTQPRHETEKAERPSILKQPLFRVGT